MDKNLISSFCLLNSLSDGRTQKINVTWRVSKLQSNDNSILDWNSWKNLGDSGSNIVTKELSSWFVNCPFKTNEPNKLIHKMNCCFLSAKILVSCMGMLSIRQLKTNFFCSNMKAYLEGKHPLCNNQYVHVVNLAYQQSLE